MIDKIDKLKELRDIQCSEGNWDSSEYMRGLANGLILAVSVFNDKEPIFKDSGDLDIEEEDINDI